MERLKWLPSRIQPCAALMRCPTCGETKTPIDFAVDNGARGNRIDITGTGRNSQCRICQNNNYIRRDARQKMVYAARARAKRAGMECSITMEDIIIPDVCPVLGIPLFSAAGGGKKPPTLLGNSPSLDRIDNSKGYTPDNIRVISMRANDLKSDATLEELEAVVAYMRDCASATNPSLLSSAYPR